MLVEEVAARQGRAGSGRARAGPAAGGAEGDRLRRRDDHGQAGATAPHILGLDGEDEL